ncbi:hypothetical protein D9M69_364280 [compost metagenome]
MKQHQAAKDPRQHAGSNGAGPQNAPQIEIAVRQECVAHDHRGMLEPADSHATKHVDERRDNGNDSGSGPVPTTEHHADPAQQHMHQHGDVEATQILGCQRHHDEVHERRKRHALRVADIGESGEQVRIPQRQFTS